MREEKKKFMHQRMNRWEEESRKLNTGCKAAKLKKVTKLKMWKGQVINYTSIEGLLKAGCYAGQQMKS